MELEPWLLLSFRPSMQKGPETGQTYDALYTTSGLAELRFLFIYHFHVSLCIAITAMCVSHWWPGLETALELDFG